jgi:apolipoprotein N-acyltransferase
VAERAILAFLLACLSGVLLVLSFPPLELGSLAWVALVPLMVAIDGRGPGKAFILSFATGLVFIVGSFYWIWWVPGYNLLDELLLGLYLGFYVAIWGFLLVLTRRRTDVPWTVAGPALWVSLEYLRSHLGFLSLPWMLLGHTQHQNIALIQIASFTGVHGLTFLIVLANAVLANLILAVSRAGRWSLWALASRRGPLWSPLAVGVLLGGVSLYGLSVTGTRHGGDRVSAALLHTSVPRDEKWDMARRRSILEQHEALTRQAAATGPQLIVWPETAVPGDVQHHAPLRQRVSQAAREANATLLVGSSEHAKFTDRRLLDRRYNSMYLFSPDGQIVGHYRKIVLVPFGEYEPLQGLVRWPKAIAAAMGSHLPGDRHTVFTLGSVPFSSVICWEIVFPDLVRRFVQGGARFIVNASNEAWFAGSAMPAQMLAMSVFRAVENRVPVVRSSNLGISAFIDPHGRITRQLAGQSADGTRVDGVLAGDISVGEAGTFYTRYGDWFALLCIVGGLAVLARAGWPVVAPWRRTARGLEAPPGPPASVRR